MELRFLLQLDVVLVLSMFLPGVIVFFKNRAVEHNSSGSKGHSGTIFAVTARYCAGFLITRVSVSPFEILIEGSCKLQTNSASQMQSLFNLRDYGPFLNPWKIIRAEKLTRMHARLRFSLQLIVLINMPPFLCVCVCLFFCSCVLHGKCAQCAMS